MNQYKNKIDVYVLDGHDKKTLGKRSPLYSDETFMIENDHNEPVADEVIRLFSLDKRFRVINITPEDSYRSIRNRAAIANKDYKVRGSRYNLSICIPIHANAFGTGWNDVSGSEALFNKGSKRGQYFAKIISKKVAEALNIPNRGAKERRDIGILRLTSMPCILTEAAFMTNKSDMVKLMSPKYRKREARAIYEGICEGFKLDPFIENDNHKNYIIKLDPDQEEELIISTKKILSSDEIINIINGKKVVKAYSISEYQDALNKAGYFCGVVDGRKGPQTNRAIEAFQRLNNLEVSGEMNPDSILKIESLRNSKNPHKTMYFNRCEVNIFTADLKEYEIGVGFGIPGKLEKLSDMAGDADCAINGQFFAGKTEGLGTLIIKGLYYFAPKNDMFTNWLEFKDAHVEVRDVQTQELYHLQKNTNFTIGTSWELIKDGEYVSKIRGGIIHRYFRHPRTLLCATGSKRIFITVDGRSKISRGMTAKECQDLLVYIEKVFAIKFEFSVNLDGGGSTEMLVNKKVANIPSDGNERKIGTFVYLNKMK